MLFSKKEKERKEPVVEEVCLAPSAPTGISFRNG